MEEKNSVSRWSACLQTPKPPEKISTIPLYLFFHIEFSWRINLTLLLAQGCWLGMPRASPPLSPRLLSLSSKGSNQKSSRLQCRVPGGHSLTGFSVINSVPVLVSFYLTHYCVWNKDMLVPKVVVHTQSVCVYTKGAQQMGLKVLELTHYHAN